MENLKTEEESGLSRSSAVREMNGIGHFLGLVENGDLDKMKEYLQDGREFDVNKYDHRGQTPLHVAASAGRSDVMEFLVSRGADVSVLDKKGDHILHTASRNGMVQPLKLIRSLGVDLNLKNKDGETALHLATRSNNLSVVEFLCQEEADVNLQDKDGESPLHVACWCGQQLRICKLLCSNKCNLNLKNKEGEAPIHFAAGRGNLEFVRILVENGADINIVNKGGSTPLHLACRRNHQVVALFLLRSGCQVDVVDQLGETPLHPACHNNLVPVVQTMCAYGCKVDVVNKGGSCPLHISTRTGHIEAVRCLLLSGVSAHQPNQFGVTAEVLAISQGHNEIAELIGSLRDKQTDCIRQLLPNEVRLERIKLKLFGHSGAGKTALVESLKCGFLGSLLRKAGFSGGSSQDGQGAYCLNSTAVSVQQRDARAESRRKSSDEGTSSRSKAAKKKVKPSRALARKMSTDNKTEAVVGSSNRQYTKGIAVQQTNIPGVGDVSVWEFSGYEPYRVCFDHFIGDPNCVHLVLFRATDPREEQLRQICFWLEFIRIRMPLSESIGKMGRAVYPSFVILVATFSNEVKADASHYRSRLNALHFDAVTMFSRDFSIYPKILSVDSSQPMSPELKALKGALHEVKTAILQGLPSTTQFFNASVAALPAWQKLLTHFPVVTWSNFKEYIRSNVNLLACEEHLKSLVYFLQIAGEIAFLESFKQDDSLVVINPRWLGQDLIPTVLDRSLGLGQLHPDGVFTRDDLLHVLFRGRYDDLDGCVEVLEAMDLLSGLEEEHVDVVYELASLVRLSRPSEREIWDPEDIRYLSNNSSEGGQGVFGGVRLVPFIFESREQLRSIFPRIQTKARRLYDSLKAIEPGETEDSDFDDRSESDDEAGDLLLWHGGFKCTRGNLEALVTEGRDVKSEWIELKARGQRETVQELFRFFHDTLAMILSAVEECAPSLEFQHQYLSPSQLSEYKECPDAYLPRNILLAQKNGNDRISRMEPLDVGNSSSPSTTTAPTPLTRNSSESARDSGVSGIDAATSSSFVSSSSLSSPYSTLTACDGERLVDVLAFGSTLVLESLVVGLDLPLLGVSVGLRRRLCAVLDPPSPTGQDWCLLSVLLGQSDELARMEIELKEAFSRTDQVMRRWAQTDERPTIRVLMEKLQKMGRLDAVDVLVNFTPLIGVAIQGCPPAPQRETSREVQSEGSSSLDGRPGPSESMASSD